MAPTWDALALSFAHEPSIVIAKVFLVLLMILDHFTVLLIEDRCDCEWYWGSARLKLSDAEVVPKSLPLWCLWEKCWSTALHPIYFRWLITTEVEISTASLHSWRCVCLERDGVPCISALSLLAPLEAYRRRGKSWCCQTHWRGPRRAVALLIQLS